MAIFDLKYLSFLVVVTYSLSSCAQTKHGIKNIHAFNTVQLPGNIEVNQNGNQNQALTDTSFFLYVEANQEINWQRATRNTKCYKIIKTEIKNSPIEIGETNIDKTKITLNPEKENRIWHLLLVPDQNCSTSFENEQNIIILEGELSGKKIRQTVNKITQLYKPPTQ